jgi:hypothetical protein
MIDYYINQLPSFFFLMNGNELEQFQIQLFMKDQLIFFPAEGPGLRE